MNEKDLFLPIKKYMEKYGFEVDGEVKKCDIVCIKEELMIAIELKKTLNYKLILQAIDRQKTFDIVYVAIFNNKNLNTKNFKQKILLLNRLGLGLIVMSPRTKKIDIRINPKFVTSNFNNNEIIITDNEKIFATYIEKSNLLKRKKAIVKKRNQILKEFNGRRLKNNIGGINKNQILTKYKEDAYIILDCLVKEKQSTGKKIKELSGIEKSTNIMYKNYYNWFEKVDRGLYKVSENGQLAYKENIKLIKKIINKIKKEN